MHLNTSATVATASDVATALIGAHALRMSERGDDNRTIADSLVQHDGLSPSVAHFMARAVRNMGEGEGEGEGEASDAAPTRDARNSASNLQRPTTQPQPSTPLLQLTSALLPGDQLGRLIVMPVELASLPLWTQRKLARHEAGTSDGTRVMVGDGNEAKPRCLTRAHQRLAFGLLHEAQVTGMHARRGSEGAELQIPTGVGHLHRVIKGWRLGGSDSHRIWRLLRDLRDVPITIVRPDGTRVRVTLVRDFEQVHEADGDRHLVVHLHAYWSAALTQKSMFKPLRWDVYKGLSSDIAALSYPWLDWATRATGHTDVRLVTTLERTGSLAPQRRTADALRRSPSRQLTATQGLEELMGLPTSHGGSLQLSHSVGRDPRDRTRVVPKLSICVQRPVEPAQPVEPVEPVEPEVNAEPPQGAAEAAEPSDGALFAVPAWRRRRRRRLERRGGWPPVQTSSIRSTGGHPIPTGV